jgi:alkylhydroperoxidase family enzyme
MRKGLTERQVQAALGDLEHAELPAPTIAALGLADRLTDQRPVIDAVFLADLRRHFDDGQILDLAVALSLGSAWQRVIEALGIRPDSWTEATALPWKDGESVVPDPDPSAR